MGKSKIILGILALILIAFTATGCVFGPSQSVDEQIDPPQEDYTEGEEDTEIVFEFDDSNTQGDSSATNEVEADSEMVDRKVYLIDHNGYVVPVTIKVPYTKGVAKQALEYMVKGGPVTPLLPSGMSAVLPAGTQLTVDVNEDGTAVVDFSPEFKEYEAKNEKKILEAITWTLTQFESIKDVSIKINGYPQEVMPVNGTPIGETVSRKDGINIEIAEGTKVGNSTALTLYFKAQDPGATYDYFVPITRLIPRTDNKALATIEQMIAGPQKGSGLYTDLIPTTKVLAANVEDEIARIHRNFLLICQYNHYIITYTKQFSILYNPLYLSLIHI